MEVVKKCSKLENEDLLKPVILKVIAECNGRIKEDAYAELIQRENYLDADVNIYNILNGIKNILAGSKDITKELVIRYVKNQETGDLFSFAKLLVCKDIAGLRKQSD